jgi:hypothetical protein
LTRIFKPLLLKTPVNRGLFISRNFSKPAVAPLTRRDRDFLRCRECHLARRVDFFAFSWFGLCFLPVLVWSLFPACLAADQAAQQGVSHAVDAPLPSILASKVIQRRRL